MPVLHYAEVHVFGGLWSFISNNLTNQYYLL